MINLILAILLAVLCTVQLKVPFLLLKGLEKSQADFDSQVFSKNSCRSSVYGSSRRSFYFSEGNELPCYFERIDFGTVDTKGHWPKSVCILINQIHGNKHSLGVETCSYQ